MPSAATLQQLDAYAAGAAPEDEIVHLTAAKDQLHSDRDLQLRLNVGKLTSRARMASSSTQIRGVAGGQGRTSPTKWEA
jgi:hypothetical protein